MVDFLVPREPVRSPDCAFVSLRSPSFAVADRAGSKLSIGLLKLLYDRARRETHETGS